MAKAKEPATQQLVETAQDCDFSEPEAAPQPRGEELETQISAIREKRAAQRRARGPAGRKRAITHYHDAERLRNLGLLSADEVVDCEEAGLLPDPAQFATGSFGLPPDEAV